MHHTVGAMSELKILPFLGISLLNEIDVNFDGRMFQIFNRKLFALLICFVLLTYHQIPSYNS